MKTYLVGGAVRDRLLGFDVRERDWVVVGGHRRTTPQAGLQGGRAIVSRVPASRYAGGICPGAARNQDRPGLPGFRSRFRPRGHAGARPDAARSDHQRDGRGRRRAPCRPLRRRARPRGESAAARIARISRRPGADPARRPIRGPLRWPGFRDRTADDGADARNGGRGRSRSAGARAGLAGDGAGIGRGRAAAVLRGVARMRRPEGGLPRDRPPLGRAATETLAPGDRYRRARDDGAGTGGPFLAQASKCGLRR